MLIHDSDNIQIVKEADDIILLSIDNGSEMVTIELTKQDLENLGFDIQVHFTNEIFAEYDDLPDDGPIYIDNKKITKN